MAADTTGTTAGRGPGSAGGKPRVPGCTATQHPRRGSSSAATGDAVPDGGSGRPCCTSGPGRVLADPPAFPSQVPLRVPAAGGGQEMVATQVGVVE